MRHLSAIRLNSTGIVKRIILIFDLQSRDRMNKVFFAYILLMIFLISLFLNPEKVGFLTCFFRQTTGHRCPTCGLSHSFYAMSHLHLQESFKFHLMGPIIYSILLFLFLKFSFEIVTKKEIQIKINPIITKIGLIIFITLWMSFWMIRFFSGS